MPETARPTAGLDPRVADLPPSARLIYFALRDADVSLSKHEIVDETALHERTVRDELAELREAGVVDRRPDPTEPCGWVHELTGPVEK